MPLDHIRYDILAQEALRGLVRKVLIDAGKNGLPGDHHFYITFDTKADGVKLSPRLRAQYPEEMTVVMQHQFWDLKITEQHFEVGMSFGGVAEKLVIPFQSITSFADPSVQFALQFEQLFEDEDADAEAETPAPTVVKSKDKPRPPAAHPSRVPAPTPATANTSKSEATPPSGDHGGGGEVVRLDRFRKK